MLDLAWASFITRVAILWIRLEADRQTGHKETDWVRGNSLHFTQLSAWHHFLSSTSSSHALWVNPAGSWAVGWQILMPYSWCQVGWSSWIRFHRWSRQGRPSAEWSTQNWCCRHCTAGRSCSRTCPETCYAVTAGETWQRKCLDRIQCPVVRKERTCGSAPFWGIHRFQVHISGSRILKISTHGAVSESVVWVSVVWSCRSELCGSGGSRCRSWQRNESTGAC